MANFRLHARAARGASSCKPLFGGTVHELPRREGPQSAKTCRSQQSSRIGNSATTHTFRRASDGLAPLRSCQRQWPGIRGGGLATAFPQQRARAKLAPCKPERLVTRRLSITNECAQPIAVRTYRDAGHGYLLARRQRQACGGTGKSDRRAIRRHHPKHDFVHRQARIDVSDREDRAVIVTAAQRITWVAAADTAVFGNDGRIRVSGSPGSP